MKPYVLDEAWIKLEDGEFVFCATEYESDGSISSLTFELGTDGESWAINSISVGDTWGIKPSKPLTGRLLTQAVSFYSENHYQEFAEHCRDHYQHEDHERLVERQKYRAA